MTVLTLLDGFDSSQHGGGKYKEAANLVKLDLTHDTEGGSKTDGHHSRVLENMVLLSQD